MLARLTLRNFQPHHRLVVDLDQITVFTGDTNAGKSAVLRALRWIAFNQPAGDDFISWGEEVCSGTLEVNGRKIRRKRGKGINTYSLDGKVYKAFGQSVPDEIASLLNLGEDNFQAQLDPPFWFTLTPGQVSRELNRVVALDLIDSVQSGVATEVRRARSVVQVSETRLTKAQQELTSLDYVDELSKDFQRLESICTLKEQTAQKRACLARSLENVSDCKARLDRLSQARLDSIACIRAGVRLRDLHSQIQSISTLLNKVAEAREQLCQSATARAAAEKRLSRIRRCPTCGQVVVSPSSRPTGT